MNLVIDAGNSRLKAALFDANRLIAKESFHSEENLLPWLLKQEIEHVLISSVRTWSESFTRQIPVTGKLFYLTHSLPLPIRIRYKTPETLGVDRIAAAVGAWNLFQGENILVIDAGTCINCEWIDHTGTYQGGAISPGLAMRFQSVHHFTARLPLLKPEPFPALIGQSTEECIQSGIVNGTVEEIKGIISRYQSNYPSLRVLLCGGDAGFFENYLKPAIFVAPDLVLMGLNGILQHNVKP